MGNGCRSTQSVTLISIAHDEGGSVSGGEGSYGSRACKWACSVHDWKLCLRVMPWFQSSLIPLVCKG